METSKPSSEGAAEASGVVLRASSDVWPFEEPEIGAKAGKRRPFRVLEERIVHLSSTSQELTHEFLKEEVERFVQELCVPVEVELVRARWLWDPDKEDRERVVASLGRGHRFSDIKMILGVDYLGKWATIHMNLAMEPERLPKPPPPPEGLSFNSALYILGGSVVGGGLGFLLTIAGALGSGEFFSVLLILGIFLMLAGLAGTVIAGAVAYIILRTNQEARTALHRKWKRKERARQEDRDLERAVRSFKVDDLRLFRSAMEKVFEKVVDGVQRRGGTVEHRVEGAHGLLGALPKPAPAAESVVDDI
jgi:hypothetical protein